MKFFFSFAETWDYLQIVITIWWLALVLEMPGIDPRTSRIHSEHSTIWATSPKFRTVEEAFDLLFGDWNVLATEKFLTSCLATEMFQSPNKRLIFFWEGISCIWFQYSVVFWRKLIKNSMSLTLEMRVIATPTSGLISGRSTIWPTSHV